ncbi:MAG TPA: GntR family transcriptional regulator [Devosia sp.]|nr:GntR family transcriptional regulator [Devosia sp.]
MGVDEIPYKFLEMPAAPARGNVTNLVTDALRIAIVTLDLKPGEVLDKAAICERLGVSRFPVSEALARLQSEGLVEILPQRGSVVSLIRIADVIEFMMIRKALESEAVRALAMCPTTELKAALEENLKAQKVADKTGDRATFHARDLQFHDLLFDAIGLDRVRTVIDSTRANLDRARRLILDPRRTTKSLGEHRIILNAISAENPVEAASAMRTHIDNVMGELLVFAETHPGVFADSGEKAQTYAFG